MAISRRNFITIAGASAAPALAQAQRGPVRISVNLLSIAANKWTPFQHLDYLAKINVQIAQFNAAILGGPAGAGDAALQKVRAHAGGLGIELVFLDGCVCPTASSFNARQGTLEEQLTRSFKIARALGSSAMKVSVGGAKERPNIDMHIESTARALKGMRSRILDSGVKLAMENHAEFQARDLKTLVEEAGRDILGVLLDAANPLFVLEDPHLTLELLAPYAVMCHVRDTAVWRVPEGVAVRWVNMGEGNVDIAGWIKKFVQMHPGVAVTLENIVSQEPHIFRVFDPQIWKDFPKMTASELSRYLALAERGKPLPPVPPSPDKSRGQQQCEDLEAGVRYTRDVLRSI